MRKIDDRLSLTDTAQSVLYGATDGHAASDAQAAAVVVTEAAAVPGHQVGGGGDGVTTLDSTPVHTTLALPGIGLGYASLDGLEDRDTAFLLTSTGLTVMTSGAKGYFVTGSNPMDAALTKILGFDHFGGFADASHDLGQLTAVTFSASKPLNPDHSAGYDITGATAADSILASGASDIVHGGAGNDTIDGSGGDDIVWGDAGNDSMIGGIGNDQLWGGAGLDTLLGGQGDDFLFGGSGNDNLQGGDGNDLMLGGLDSDSLTGGDGDDVLVGGGGADTLTGGAGHDLFLFAEGDSGVGAAQDVVTDFTIGEDKLDLTSFTKALHVVTAFDHHAYEMTLTDQAQGTLISIDLNGDGVADQEIAVTTSDGAHLSSSDFVI